MIRLESLTLKAFRSFVEETKFDFPSSGLVLINGSNLQTNDASGTGKSSIFLGVAYALNILPEGFTAAGLQSFLTKDKMQVSVRLKDDSETICISRGKETYVEYVGQNRRYEGATLVNAEIEKVFGLNGEMLFAMAYRPQDSGSLFLSKNDTAKIEFLTQLLKLDRIERAVDMSEGLARELTKELAIIEAQIKSKEETLAKIVLTDTNDTQTENNKLAIEIGDYEADNLLKKKQIEEEGRYVKEESNKINKKWDYFKHVITGELALLEFDDKGRKAGLDLANEKRHKIIEELTQILGVVSSNKKEVAQLELQAEKLRNSACPTCEKPWDKSVSELKKVENKIASLNKEIGMEPVVKEQIQKCKEAITTFNPNPKIKELQDSISDIPNQIMAEKLKLPVGTGTATANSISENLMAINELTSRLNKNKIVIEKQKELKALYDSINSELSTLKSKKDDVASRLQTETDFVGVLGKKGFLGSIFDEVLAEIVAEINTKLCGVANMSTVTFDFKTEKTDSKGSVKKSIVPVVTILGHETRMASLSGGMKSSLGLIVDLAVKEVIERRTGKQIGFYFVDEAFNGMGTPSKEATLDILKQSAQNKVVCVIDHHSEVKELFNQTIHIEMNNGVSKIK